LWFILSPNSGSINNASQASLVLFVTGKIQAFLIIVMNACKNLRSSAQSIESACTSSSLSTNVEVFSNSNERAFIADKATYNCEIK
jgi:hypothetical protein